MFVTGPKVHEMWVAKQIDVIRSLAAFVVCGGVSSVVLIGERGGRNNLCQATKRQTADVDCLKNHKSVVHVH